MNLLTATQNGNIAEVQQLINDGAYLDVTDNDGETPLHIATSNGHTEIALTLIEKGANINATDRLGETPLHRATSNSHSEIALTLIAKGANVNATDRLGCTPLLLALRNGHTDRDTMMVKIKMLSLSTKAKNPYLKIMSLFHNKHEAKQKAPSSLPTELLRMVLQYAGLLPSNLDIDLEKLVIDKTPSTNLVTNAVGPAHACPRPTRDIIPNVTMTRGH